MRICEQIENFHANFHVARSIGSLSELTPGKPLDFSKFVFIIQTISISNNFLPFDIDIIAMSFSASLPKISFISTNMYL